MAKFYFTYEGTDFLATCGQTPYRQPYKGGWTEVVADGALSAHAIYDDIHPHSRGSFWFYNRVLNEESFRMSGFAETGINGYKCVERISLKVDILERGAVNVG